MRSWAPQSSLGRIDGCDDEPPKLSGGKELYSGIAKGNQRDRGEMRGQLLTNQTRRSRSYAQDPQLRTCNCMERSSAIWTTVSWRTVRALWWPAISRQPMATASVPGRSGWDGLWTVHTRRLWEQTWATPSRSWTLICATHAWCRISTCTLGPATTPPSRAAQFAWRDRSSRATPCSGSKRWPGWTTKTA
jgi:hypothetical protein